MTNRTILRKYKEIRKAVIKSTLADLESSASYIKLD